MITFSQVTDVVTMIGVLGVTGTLYATKRLRKSALAQDYIKRYWEISDQWMTETVPARQGAGDVHVRRYLQLCEDEYEMAALGLIDSRIWPVWHAGVCATLCGTMKARIDAVLVADAA